MKRLLLLFILSPVILSAQQQGQGAVDSMLKAGNDHLYHTKKQDKTVGQDTAAINLQNTASSMGNDKCTKVADIRITDNGAYTTTVIFLHDTTVAIANTSPDPSAYTKDPPAHIADMETVPPRIIGISAPIAAIITGVSVPVAEMHVPTDTPAYIADMETVPPRIMGISAPIAAIITGVSVPVAEMHVPTDTPAHIADMETVPPGIIEIGAPIADIITGISVPVAEMYAPADTSAHIVDTVTTPPGITETKTPIAEMHLSADGYSLLQKLEGYSPALYSLHDGGYTIGFGFFIPINESYKWRNGITWEGAEKMIQQKVPMYEDQVKEYINVPLTQNEFDALTMLAYNLGGFSKATSIINDINEQVDVDKLQRDWKKFVHSKAPNVSKGLMKRRNDEIEVRKLSNYQPDRKIQIFKSNR